MSFVNSFEKLVLKYKLVYMSTIDTWTAGVHLYMDYFQ